MGLHYITSQISKSIFVYKKARCGIFIRPKKNTTTEYADLLHQGSQKSGFYANTNGSPPQMQQHTKFNN